MVVCEDNEATIKILQTGRSMALRHLTRTHKINIQWTVEALSADDLQLKFVPTKSMVADIFTKPFKDKPLWDRLIILSGHGDSSVNQADFSPMINPSPSSTPLPRQVQPKASCPRIPVQLFPAAFGNSRYFALPILPKTMDAGPQHACAAAVPGQRSR